MFEKLLIFCCYFDYHPKTKLVDVKIGFGPSGKIEKVRCEVCQKVFIRNNKNTNQGIVIVLILVVLLLILLL